MYYVSSGRGHPRRNSWYSALGGWSGIIWQDGWSPEVSFVDITEDDFSGCPRYPFTHLKE